MDDLIIIIVFFFISTTKISFQTNEENEKPPHRRAKKKLGNQTPGHICDDTRNHTPSKKKLGKTEEKRKTRLDVLATASSEHQSTDDQRKTR